MVTNVKISWPGAAELAVDVDGVEMRALAYVDLVGEAQPGDRVVLNTTALDLGLGTGGYAHVVAIPDRLPADPPPAPGHLVKARYTPLQTTVLGVDEQDSEWHAALRDADDLFGMPVVVADLHSALPAILAGLWSTEDSQAGLRSADRAPGPIRVAYVMTDGGALPLPFSRNVAQLRAAGLLTATVTVGQAFGGDLEAVTLHTGLLAAKHVVGADIAIVTQGPGNLGTGTRWGFSGVACGEAINAAVVLGGRPVGSLRISSADPRGRHHGVSHHSLTAYSKVALAPADIVVPDLPGEFGEKVRTQAARLAGRHNLISAPVAGLEDELRRVPVHLSTMGRGLEEDPEYFVAAAAAGAHAATLLRHDG